VDDGSHLNLSSRDFYKELIRRNFVASPPFKLAGNCTLSDFNGDVHHDDLVGFGFYLFLRFKLEGRHGQPPRTFLHPILVHIREKAKGAHLVFGQMLCMELEISASIQGKGPYLVEGSSAQRKLGVVRTTSVRIPLSEEMSQQLGEKGRGPLYCKLRELEVKSGDAMPTAFDRIEKSVVRIGKVVTAEAAGSGTRSKGAAVYDKCCSQYARYLQSEARLENADEVALGKLGLKVLGNLNSRLLALQPMGVRSDALVQMITAWVDPSGGSFRNKWRQRVRCELHENAALSEDLRNFSHQLLPRWNCGLSVLVELGVAVVSVVEKVKKKEMQRAMSFDNELRIPNFEEGDLKRMGDACELLEGLLDPLGRLVPNDIGRDCGPSKLVERVSAMVEVVAEVYYTAMATNKYEAISASWNVNKFLGEEVKLTEREVACSKELTIERLMESTGEMQASMVAREVVPHLQAAVASWWNSTTIAYRRTFGDAPPRFTGFGVYRNLGEPTKLKERLQNGDTLQNLSGPVKCVKRRPREVGDSGDQRRTAIVTINGAGAKGVEMLQERLLVATVYGALQQLRAGSSLAKEAGEVLRRLRKLLGDDGDLWQELCQEPTAGEKRKADHFEEDK